MTDFLAYLQPQGDKLITSLETKNGYHMITKPFNMEEFLKKYTNVNVKKDNPTITYIP